MNKVRVAILGMLAVAIIACNSKPKAIEGEPIDGQGETSGAIFQDAPMVQEGNPAHQNLDAAPHKVVARETLNTAKYSYVRVEENGEEFWIAILKRDITIGGTYYFTGGLLKRNFQSQEFNRTFDKVYLVSDFREEGSDDSAIDQAFANAQQTDAPTPPANVKPVAGAITISELVGHLSKYEGKTVKITGKCMKINPMIMGRNWIHLQDGSGKNLDLTVTTADQVQLGEVVTFEGVIALNKDFGAGYRYDYIMESAVRQ